MALYDQSNLARDILMKLRGATASAIAAQSIAQPDYEQAQAEADKWEKNYQLALKNGRKDLVSTAQFQRDRCKAIASRLKLLVEQQMPQVDTFKRNLTSWESRVSEAENEALVTQLNSSSAITTFERMEEKVLQIEAASELASQQDDADKDREFTTFVNFENIDNELARLEAELLDTQLQHQAVEVKAPKEILEEVIQETREAVNSAIVTLADAKGALASLEDRVATLELKLAGLGRLVG